MSTIVITGGSAGLGLLTSRHLAQLGHRAVIAVRDEQKGRDVADRIMAEVPGSVVQVLPCDLASLASVRHAAEQLNARSDRPTG